MEADTFVCLHSKAIMRITFEHCPKDIKKLCFRLFQQDSNLTNGGCRLVVYFGNRLQFKVTRRIFLTETNKIRNRIVHDVTEFSTGIALSPILAIDTNIEIILINRSRKVFFLRRCLTETDNFRCFTHIHHQRSQSLSSPYSLRISVNGISRFRRHTHRFPVFHRNIT